MDDEKSDDTEMGLTLGEIRFLALLAQIPRVYLPYHNDGVVLEPRHMREIGMDGWGMTAADRARRAMGKG